MNLKQNFLRRFFLILAAFIAFGTAACKNEPALPARSELKGSVSIPEIISIGDTVEANTSALGGKGAIKFQWQTSNAVNGTFSNIPGATENPFFIIEADRVTAGRFIRVRVSRSGSEGFVNSNAVELQPANVLSGSVSIPQTIALGATITADTTALGGNGAISYRWETSNTVEGTYTAITGATDKNFVAALVTVGHYIRVTVTRSGNIGSVSSNAAAIGPATSPPSGSVSIPQIIALGDTIGANTSALGGSGTFSYQWQTGASATGSFSDITGANERIFIVQGAGVTAGRFLRVLVSRSGNSGSVASNAVEITAARPRAFIDFSGYTGSADLASHQPPSATAGDFTLANGITGSGLRLSNDGEGTTVTISSQHSGQMTTRTQDGGGFQYFYIDKPAIKAAATVTMYLTFFDNTSGNINLQYRRQGDTTGDRFFQIQIRRNNTGAFATATVELESCDFMAGEQQNQGAQFRFPGGTLIKRLELVEGGAPDPAEGPPPEFAPATQLNNMIGKTVAGYQAWFRAEPGTSWHHWQSSGGGNTPPAPGNITVEIWPAGFEDYTANGATLRSTGFTMPNGTTAQLFNSRDREIIRTQLKWMQDAEIDCAAPQRFYGDGVGGSAFAADTGSAVTHLTMIRDAAEEFGRIFYVMYDMTGTGSQNQDTVFRRMQLDWIYNVENKGLVSSPNYAQAEGKPVVCFWGIHAIESTDNDRYIKIENTMKLIKWFRDRGYYIIGGIPDDEFWTRSGRGKEMYCLVDMISPWYIGRDVNRIESQWLNSGTGFCTANARSWASNKPIAFMPTIWPGFAWTNMSGNSGPPNHIPRNAGQHIWTQIRGYLNKDTTGSISSIYLAMLDEYDEGTNWMKAGADYFDIPVSQYFQTLSTDGIWLSSDYYLRMAKAASAALQSKIASAGTAIGPLNDYGNANSVIVEHSEGPVFWRNSFERRTGRLKYGTNESDGNKPYEYPVYHLQLDPGVPNGEAGGSPQNITVSGPFTVNRPRVDRHEEPDNYVIPSTTLGMVYSDAKSGDSSFRLEGTRTAGSGASYLYKIANTRIKASSAMSLSFWQKAGDALGANVIVELKLDNGNYLSGLSGYSMQNTGTPVNGWQQKTVNLPAAVDGHYITEVIVAYKDAGTATGSFSAWIDDIIIGNK